MRSVPTSRPAGNRTRRRRPVPTPPPTDEFTGLEPPDALHRARYEVAADSPINRAGHRLVDALAAAIDAAREFLDEYDPRTIRRAMRRAGLLNPDGTTAGWASYFADTAGDAETVRRTLEVFKMLIDCQLLRRPAFLAHTDDPEPRTARARKAVPR